MNKHIEKISWLTTLILNPRLANANTTNTNANGHDYIETVNSSRRSHQEHTERHEVVFETFSVKITEKGWQLRGDVPEDGHCCFWAISDQLDKNGLEAFSHVELRKNVVGYVENLLNVSFQLYLFVKFLRRIPFHFHEQVYLNTFCFALNMAGKKIRLGLSLKTNNLVHYIILHKTKFLSKKG